MSTTIAVLVLFLTYVWWNLMALGLDKCAGPSIEVTCPHIAAAIHRTIWLGAFASAAVVLQWLWARRLSHGWRLAMGFLPPILSLLALLSSLGILGSPA